jgi:hypothetical protein
LLRHSPAITIMQTIRLFILAGAASCLFAVETKTWVQSEAAEFEKGSLKHISIASDGHVSLAPVFRELYDPAVAYLWCAAVDSKGNVYSGGSGGKVFMVSRDGKGKTLATIAGGDVYALAINRKDEVFAALSPDAKIYRISSSGNAELFYDPKAKYVWALVFDPAGNLFAATGDQGKVVRVTPDGKGDVFFETDETHARSLAFDGAGNLIVGTEPGGLVIRVSPKREGFVLYQSGRREITSIAVAKDGSIYAVGVGGKSAPPSAPPPAPAPPAPTASTSTQSAQPQPVRQTSPPPASLSTGPVVSGGSDLYRIAADGHPQRVWTSSQQVAYAIAFDSRDRLVAATGNQGVIYRIESDRVSTRLLDAEPAQFTALALAPGGALFAVTANAGKICQIGPELEKEGTLESEPFDAGSFTYWGRLHWNSDLNGGAVAVEARSGNLDGHQKFWSPWAPVTASGASRIQAPAARFLAWRATLTAAPDGRTPVLSLVEAAYQAKNVAPVIDRIEITPANYKFPGASLTASSSSTLTLPPIGQPRRSSPSSGSEPTSSTASLTYDKGSIGARWRASDANGDTLSYRVEIRGAAEHEWKLLKDNLKETKYSWDSTTFADGSYLLRVTASDAIDNYPGQALTAEIISEPFSIDNSPPQISGLAARIESGKIVIRFKATDAVTPLSLAEYSLNGGEWISAEPTTRLTDSLEHEYSVTVDKPAGTEFTIAVRVTDENDNTSVEKVVIRAS